MKHVYKKPLTEVVRVNCKEKLAWGEHANSNNDPYAGARAGNFIDEGTINKDAQPVFDKWKSPIWDD